MNDSELHSDLYSVAPAAMSDEQIALRDAMSIVSDAESVAAIAGSLHALMDGLCKSVERLERERDEMRTVLKDIVRHHYLRPSFWIPSEMLERAEKLLAGG